MVTFSFKIRALWCFAVTLALFVSPANAGRQGVVLPDGASSGVGDQLTGTTSSEGRIVAPRLQSIALSEVVPTFGGQSLEISNDQVEVISRALTASGSAQAPAVAALQLQLDQELPGLDVEISALGNSPADYRSAVQAYNALINGLNEQQLEMVVQSPTVMAIANMLGAALETPQSDVDAVVVEEGQLWAIPMLSLN